MNRVWSIGVSAASGGGWLGRANHPWLAAAEQGCSALPRANGAISRGDRKPGGCCGGCIFGSQVSAVGYQVQVFRFGYRSREFHSPTANRFNLSKDS